MLIKIDKKVPIPKGRRNYKYPISDMKVGDSFLAEDRCSVWFCAISWCKRNGKNWKFKIKREDKQFRIWRTS